MFFSIKDADARRVAARKLTVIVLPMGSCVVNTASAKTAITAKKRSQRRLAIKQEATEPVNDDLYHHLDCIIFISGYKIS